MTRSEGRLFERWTKQTVCTQDPHPHSPAALVLVARLFYRQDSSIYNETRMQRVSKGWLKARLKELGSLNCWVCGKPLEILPPMPDGRVHPKAATLDHEPPISQGTFWRDASSFRVACYACNAARNNRRR